MTRAQFFGILLGTALVTCLTAVRAFDPDQLKLARELVFDQYQRLAPRAYEPMPVRVVDIDEASLEEIGQWPWPRDRIALLVDRLNDLGAAAVAFDILFSEPDRLSPRNIVSALPNLAPDVVASLPDNDELLAGAIKDRPVVLGFGITNHGDFRPPVKAGFAYTGEPIVDAPPRFAAATPLRPGLAENAAGIGHISLNPQAASSVIRKVPLFLTDGQQLYPGLALEALRVAQGASTYLLVGSEDGANTLTAVRNGDALVPLTTAGELWLYVSPDTRARYVSIKDLLHDAAPTDAVRQAIEGNIVFVGTSAPGLQDIRTTALGENVPGVSLHAQIVEQIMSGHYLWRPDWADGLEIASIFLLGLLLVVLTLFFSPSMALIVGLLITAYAFAASWFAFAELGLLLDPLAPVIAGSTTHFAATAYRFLVTDRQRRQIRHAFEQYMSPSLLHRIETMQGALKLGGDERELTMMFVDVRNFTTMSESLTPSEVIKFLNTLLDALSRCVIGNEGTLDKFIGDSIMAFWNAPLDVKNHPEKAVRAALQMRETLRRLNEADAFGFGRDNPVSIGVGIHTGLACVGNMGAEARFNYSAVGDAVNVAARIESSCKSVQFDILVSGATADRCPDFAMLDAGALPLKGKRSRMHVFAAVGDQAVKQSQLFADASASHAALLQAIATDADDLPKLQAHARADFIACEPMLGEFCDGILEHPGRFGHRAAAAVHRS
jgi:adenylate cyclase